MPRGVDGDETMTRWASASKRVDQAKKAGHFVPGLQFWTAPMVPAEIWFTPQELGISIARNVALTGAPVDLLDLLDQHIRDLLAYFVDESGSQFQTSADVALLGDAKMIHVAHDIGCGVAGLLMENMGYRWRCNGKEVLGTGKIPDYVWTVPSQAGALIVSEVKGSIGPSVTGSAINRRAKDGFHDQVADILGTFLPGMGRIVYGYGLGIHAPGGKNTSGFYVHHPSFTNRTPSGPPPSGGGEISVILLRHHLAGLFRAIGMGILANAFASGFWPIGRAPVTFIETEIDGELFWTSAERSLGRLNAGEYVTLLSKRDAEHYLRLLLTGQLAQGSTAINDTGSERVRRLPQVTISWDGLAIGRRVNGKDVKKAVWPPKKRKI
jgi:hypothetical protein